MKEKKRLEITFETHELTVIRFQQNETCFCRSCRASVPHLSLAQAVVALSLSGIEIQQLVSEGKIHLIAGANGTLLLCGNSLAAFQQNKKEQTL